LATSSRPFPAGRTDCATDTAGQIVCRISRHHRHDQFDESFQQELATLYRPSKRGHPPIAPAQLALAVILQAYTGVSDDEVIEAILMDRRWQ
jgi:hypothetical protein